MADTPERRRIYKFPVRISSAPQTFDMPRGAKIQHVHAQELGSEVRACLWAEVDPAAPGESRTFAVYATGEDIFTPSEHVYVGTVHVDWTVWHVYEILRR